MNVFIDTNVFLSFYHFSNDALEELKKLGVLLEQVKVRLYLPQQVVQEFARNRENKIADALRQLREQKLDLRFPEFCKEYEEYENLRELQRHYSKVHAQLIEKVTSDVQSQQLKADEVIQGLFEKAVHLPTDDQTREMAQDRMAVGNPPGKSGSLGDAINWESLLRHAPNGDALYFITDDRDYASPIDPDALNGFLDREWSEEKHSEIFYYKSLSEFFREHFPKIALASELEKDLVIESLANSSSFAETHSIIRKLSRFSDFTIAQINAIVQAANSNNQVYWIIDDPDIETFLLDLIKGKENQLDQLGLRELLETIADAEEAGEGAPPDPEDEIPF